MTRRKGKAKKRSQRYARQRASDRQKSQEPAPAQPTTGELITDSDGGSGAPMDSRSDRRFAARLLSLGIISEEESEAILKKAFRFAASAQSVRDYTSAMRVVTAAAKAESEHLKLQQGNVHKHVHLDLGRANGIADTERDRLSAITERLTGTSMVVGSVPERPGSRG